MKKETLLYILTNFLFPHRCASCGLYLNKAICSRCLKKLPKIYEPVCQRCGKPCLYEVSFCRECHDKHFLFKNRSYGLYEDNLQKIILKYKFEHFSRLSNELAKLVTLSLTEEFKQVDYVTHVPMAKKKERIRGYNQSELLARQISLILDLPFKSLLFKDRNTSDQNKLPLNQRLINLRQVFSPVDERKYHGRVLLIDDVMTTGATLQECSKVLKGMGFEQVYTATIARSITEL